MVTGGRKKKQPKTTKRRLGATKKTAAKPRAKATTKTLPPVPAPRSQRKAAIDIDVFRTSQLASKNEAHAQARDIIIPRCADWGRRLELEHDTPACLML
jgi:hypothetical protein